MFQDAMCQDALSQLHNLSTAFRVGMVVFIIVVAAVIWAIWKIEEPYRAERKGK